MQPKPTWFAAAALIAFFFIARGGQDGLLIGSVTAAAQGGGAGTRIFSCSACKCEPDQVRLVETYSDFKGRYSDFTVCVEQGQLSALTGECHPFSKDAPAPSCSPERLVPPQLRGCADEVPATLLVAASAPARCGYNWKGFNANRFKRDIANFLRTETPPCSPSMCTSSAFLALLGHLKRLQQAGKISSERVKELSSLSGAAWSLLNVSATPNDLVEELGLGEGHVQYRSEIGEGGVPKEGDLVQIWRRNNSGHSVVFKGFLYDGKQKAPIGICYWSSQTQTRGYGNRCEPLRVVDRILIGSLND